MSTEGVSVGQRWRLGSSRKKVNLQKFLASLYTVCTGCSAKIELFADAVHELGRGYNTSQPSSALGCKSINALSLR
jgi:hypothetical protein